VDNWETYLIGAVAAWFVLIELPRNILKQVRKSRDRRAQEQRVMLADSIEYWESLEKENKALLKWHKKNPDEESMFTELREIESKITRLKARAKMTKENFYPVIANLTKESDEIWDKSIKYEEALKREREARAARKKVRDTN
jgi:hypothetical protein